MKPAWLERLKKSIAKNKRDAHNRYFQLATIAADGTPRVRMVVFRGFSDDSLSLSIITDTRSQKISELANCSSVEIGWYFTHTREQYRLRCDSKIYTATDDSQDARDKRERIWSALSEAAKEQFFWLTPGVPEGAGEAPGFTATLPDTFAVIVFEPHSVDHLVLAKQQMRTRSVRVDGDWSEKALNP